MEPVATFIDTAELTRLGQTVDGQVALTHFKRLGAGLPAQGNNMVKWSVRGLQDVTGQQALEIHVRAEVMVECQRCMQDMAYPVDSTSVLQVVQTEAELDELEDQQDSDPDTWIEPVLASSRLDVLELVEDELILSLPYVPVHSACSHDASAQLQSEPTTDSSKESPFAILTQLKKN